MAAALGPEVRVTDVRPLAGGAATAVELVTLAGAASQQVVLKRFPPGLGSPEKEWDALGFARKAGLPSPQPLLYDDGAWFGSPSIVMTALDGALCLTPTNLESWATALVEPFERRSMRRHSIALPLLYAGPRSGTVGTATPSVQEHGLTPSPPR